ncbi:ureidoglycolate hydrolase [Stachybotrys elegans]|uniref:Ureidoglycolate hydrolase n=1 Tax=Stachybotrys elegans TaxID=80388 RepID=A0A8K0SYK2_9HYPO|nr:ureidoglycolate hydrolase [Stachybotrys elegans]
MTTLTVSIGEIDVRVVAQPLTQETFAPYGDVIGNPRPDVHPAAFDTASSLPANAFSANQGFAIQYRAAGRVRNLYDQAPSGVASPAISLFCCAARELARGSGPHPEFVVRVLERHPFTTQTFSPLESSADAYLVVVAPSRPPSALDESFPTPVGRGLPGRGLPELRFIKAFIASKRQAVTYGAGTWHAPMVALGKPGTTLNFVVTQFASGVAVEDCQLVEFVSEQGVDEDPRIKIAVPQATARQEKL